MSFFPIFSSWSYMVFGLMFIFLIHFELIFVSYIRGSISLFCICFSSFSSTVCSRPYPFPTGYSWLPCWTLCDCVLLGFLFYFFDVAILIPVLCVCVKSLSCVRLFATPWTVAHQAPPSMRFSRQEYWSGLSFPSPGDLPDPWRRSNPGLPHCGQVL